MRTIETILRDIVTRLNAERAMQIDYQDLIDELGDPAPTPTSGSGLSDEELKDLWRKLPLDAGWVKSLRAVADAAADAARKGKA